MREDFLRKAYLLCDQRGDDLLGDIAPRIALHAFCSALGRGLHFSRREPSATARVLVNRFRGVVAMPQGKIKKLVLDKGFGFIKGDRGEFFFHHSAVQGGMFDSLQEGQTVEYEEGHGPKGPRAENIRVIG